MSDDHTTDLNPLDPHSALTVNANPLQRPGTDTLLRTSTVGGPDLPGDRRVFLSARLLDDLLQRAKASPTLRVQIDHAGVRVDLYRQPDGHQYEVWTLIGAPPRAESMPAVIQALVNGGTIGGSGG